MFSNLGPLFKTVFRQAEETDTRQAIQREDKKQNRKRKENEEGHRISIDLWEDKSSVSVEALQSFLITFIKGETFEVSTNNKNDQENNSNPHNAASKERPQIKNEAQTTVQKRAISAYQSMNEKVTAPTNLPKPQTPIADADLIESKEAREIYKLIEDLDFLKERGVIEIFIEPADNFVESLRQAVYIEKLKLKKS
jgi:hypothetical protein